MSSFNYNDKVKTDRKNLGHNINEKEETILDLYMLLIGYAVIICFGAFFHMYFYNIIPTEIFKLSIIANIVFPLVLYTYYIFYEINSVRENITYDKLLKEAQQEIKEESRVSSVIPVILFGIGIVYGNLQKISISKKKNLLKIVAPYLVFSLLFGTVIPHIILYLIIDHSDLHRMLIASDIDFISMSISFGLMVTTLLTPFLLLY